MGLIRDIVLGQPDQARPVPNVEAASAGIQPYRVARTAVIPPTQFSTNRIEAMAVPAVARARNLVAGTIASMPFEQFVSDQLTGELTSVTPLPWVRQPEVDTPRSTTIAYTADSLWFYGRAYWQVTETYAEDGRPARFRWIDPTEVTFDVDLEGRITRYYYRLNPVPTSGPGSLVVFTYVDEGLLRRAGQTIKTCVELERAALDFARNPAPSIALKNTGVDLPAEQVSQLLSRWREARAGDGGTVAYLSSALELETVGFSPKDLAMVEARQFQVNEIARATGIPPALLGASIGSMTYQNVQAERRALVDLSLQPVISSIEQRLSMDDVTPRGTSVMIVVNDFLRATPIEEAQLLSVLLDRQVITIDEARRRIGEPGGPIA